MNFEKKMRSGITTIQVYMFILTIGMMLAFGCLLYSDHDLSKDIAALHVQVLTDGISDVHDCYFEHHCITGTYCEVTDFGSTFNLAIIRDDTDGEILSYEDTGTDVNDGIQRCHLTAEVTYDGDFIIHRWDIDKDAPAPSWELVVCNGDNLSIKLENGSIRLFARASDCADNGETFGTRVFKAVPYD